MPPSLRREVVEMAERTCPACGSLHHRPRNRLCGRCEYIRRRDVLLSTCRQDTEVRAKLKPKCGNGIFKKQQHQRKS